MKRFFIASLITLSTLSLYAQHTDGHSHKHGWELGFGIGYAPIINEANAISSHIHLMKSFHGLERFQFGISFEKLFDDHKHSSLGFLVSYNIFKDLYLGVSPGILFTKHELEWERSFATHFELHYAFKLNGIHLGPLLEYAISKEDKHYMIGLHLGIEL